jgi:hypothetical protein
MSDTTLWAPPAEVSPLHAGLRAAIRAMLPALIAAARHGQNGPLIHDFTGPPDGRLELRLQGSTLLRRGARDAVKFSLAGHAGNTRNLWAVAATLVMDRQTRAVLSLDVASEARRG